MHLQGDHFFLFVFASPIHIYPFLIGLNHIFTFLYCCGRGPV